MNAPRRWTEEKLATFFELCRDGVPRDIIAKDLGWTVKRVAGLDHYLRQQNRQPYRLPLSTLHHRCPLNGKEAEIAQMSADGLSARAIAKHFGVTRLTAIGFMSSRGLFCRSRRRPRAPKPQDRKPITMPKVGIRLIEDFDRSDLRAGNWLTRAMEEAV